MTTNPRSEINETGNMQPSGSGGKRSMGVNASDNESLDSENEDIPLKASEMRDLRHPVKPIHQNDTTLDATVIFNEESDNEDYHMVTGANKPLHRQSTQNTQLLNDTLGSHADSNTSTSTTKPLDSVNQIAQAIEKLANKNYNNHFFTLKTQSHSMEKTRKMENSNISRTYSTQPSKCSQISQKKGRSTTSMHILEDWR